MMSNRHSYTDNLPSQMNKNDFVACFGFVYEHSPWIAEIGWDRELTQKGNTEYDSAEKIHKVLRDVVNDASRNRKLQLLQAHPDLAGKLAVAGKITEESRAEQASADLANCTPEEFGAFQRLNTEYNKKFGFPFILAVRGFKRKEILEIFQKRRHNDFETEFATALEQVHRIAYLRLKDIS